MSGFRWAGFCFQNLLGNNHEYEIAGQVSDRIEVVTKQWKLSWHNFGMSVWGERVPGHRNVVEGYRFSYDSGRRPMISIFDQDACLRIGFGEWIEPFGELITMEMVDIFRIHFLNDTEWMGEIPLGHLGIWRLLGGNRVSRLL